MRRKEQVNVIRHNHPGMQIAARLAAVLNRTADQAGNFRSLQVDGSEASSIEEPVHRNKRLPGCHAFFWKFAANRQTAIQPKGHENGLSNGMDVRQTAL